MMQITITVPGELASRLESVRKEYYSAASQNAMLRDLILRGLKREKQEEKSTPHFQRDQR